MGRPAKLHCKKGMDTGKGAICGTACNLPPRPLMQEIQVRLQGTERGPGYGLSQEQHLRKTPERQPEGRFREVTLNFPHVIYNVHPI